MTLRILSIGKTNIRYVNEGIEQFLNRLKHYVKLSWEELPDAKNAAQLSNASLKKAEGNLILSKLKTGDLLILLDETGKSMTSVEFAEWLEHKSMHAAKDMVFVVGGAYGFSDEVYTRADFKLSLSKMTFNHQLIRLVFAEQLYRAFTIQRGEPYHHS